MGISNEKTGPMSRRGLKFRHQVIDPAPPGGQHDITLLADINGDGRPEIIIGGKDGPPNLFWYENPSWVRHDVAEANDLEAGGVVFDVNRDGRPDIIAGQQIHNHHLFWFENPPDPTRPWRKHVIEDRFEKYHDQCVGDVDGDGQDELVVLSQRAGVLVYYDVPEDPTVEPWPRSCCHVIADDVGHRLEGLRVADLDRNGKPVLLAGTYVFRRQAEGAWIRQCYAQGYDCTRVAVGDLADSDRLDIVIAEGESHPGRLALCLAPDFEPVVLRDDLFHPHSLEIADFDGDGRPDIFVAEMGLGRNPDPRMFVFRNRGGGHFEEVLIHHGTPTHEAKAADLTGNGRPDIVGKPYKPERHIDVWFNET